MLKEAFTGDRYVIRFMSSSCLGLETDLQEIGINKTKIKIKNVY